MTLEQIATEIVLTDSSDKDACTKILDLIRDFAGENAVPAAIRQAALAAVDTAQELIDKNSPDAALSLLSAALDSLLKDEAAAGSNSALIIDEDLIHEFLAAQPSVLADFESLCLKLDAGHADAMPALRRQIHTWKGESGVIGLTSLNAELHRVEEALESAAILSATQIADSLFLLKDALQQYFENYEHGHQPQADLSSVIEQFTSATNATDAPAPSTASVPQVITEPTSTPVATASQESKVFSLPEDIDLDLVQEFRSESAEHFQNAEVALMNLDSNPADSEAVNVVFRAFHTVKGVSSFVGTTYITELAHKAETYLDKFRKGTLVMGGAYTDLAFASLDLLKKLLAQLNDAIATKSWTASGEYLDLLVRLDHSDDMAAQPSRAAEPKAGQKVGEILIAEGKATAEAVDHALQQQAEGDPRPVGQILVEQSAATPKDVTQALRSQQPASGKESEGDATVKVSTLRLDNLINMVGELVIAQSMVSQDPSLKSFDQRLLRNMAQLGKITRSMQELALSMRMITVKGTFQKMARLVRDLARKSKKEINLEISGEETELDRNMVEAIADPLVHMIRNSCDHGVESPDDRAQAGKARSGTVQLSAHYEGGSVVIKIQDDGRGLNTEKIMRKAIERGLVEADANLSEQEIHNLIWLPGFSTADKVTDVSGRGVGMDVVRTNIEALRGAVDIHSVWGQGTTFIIRLPLTLAIIDGMIVRVGQERFIIPITSITESYRPAAADLTTIAEKQELTLLRGELLSVARLSRMFGIQASANNLIEGTLIVLETKNSKRFALHVDELLGQQQVVIKSLGDMFAAARGVSGGAILGDGRVCLILDVEGLAKMSMAA